MNDHFQFTLRHNISETGNDDKNTFKQDSQHLSKTECLIKSVLRFLTVGRSEDEMGPWLSFTPGTKLSGAQIRTVFNSIKFLQRWFGYNFEFDMYNWISSAKQWYGLSSESFRMCPSGSMYRINKIVPASKPWGAPQDKMAREDTMLTEAVQDK